MAPAALVFDFNGTLSDDEPVLCRIYRELFAQYGRAISDEDYYERLSGHAEHAIAEVCLGAGDPRIPEFVRQRIDRYRAAVADGSTITEPLREAVRLAGARVPLAVVSGAAREEIVPVVEAAGLGELLSRVVADDDVAEGKPHPESYLRALALVGNGIAAADVLAFEDTEAGVASARAAGLRCVAVLGTQSRERLAAADEIVERIDAELVRRLLS